MISVEWVGSIGSDDDGNMVGNLLTGVITDEVGIKLVAMVVASGGADKVVVDVTKGGVNKLVVIVVAKDRVEKLVAMVVESKPGNVEDKEGTTTLDNMVVKAESSCVDCTAD